MIDHAAKLRVAMNEFKAVTIGAELNRNPNERERVKEQAIRKLGIFASQNLEQVLAELEARRAAMGEDITTQAGFSGRETEAMK